MPPIDISTNWLSSIPIDSCIFVKYFNNDDFKDNDSNDSEPNEDIEKLLESYENCVNICPPNELNEDTKEAKIFIKPIDDSEDEFTTAIDSFSMLCSAKVIEIHGNQSNEYLNTLFNELVEELDGLSMFRSDYQLVEPQKQLTITFKSFNQLWIYGLVIKLRRVKTKPGISSKDMTGFSTIFSMLSMFANSSTSKSNSSTDLIRKIAELKTSDENKEQIEKQNKSKVQNTSLEANCSDTLVSETTNSTSDGHKPEQQFCECFCHKNCVFAQNSNHFHQYIDQKFIDLEKSIENKFNSLENKMFSVLNLFINKQ